VGLGKYYILSKGLGYEFSPIKTRSAHKKVETSSTLPNVHQTPHIDLGVLRDMKSLVRAKP